MKCDNKECKEEAIFLLRERNLEFQINVCYNHYKELAGTRDWEIK